LRGRDVGFTSIAERRRLGQWCPVRATSDIRPAHRSLQRRSPAKLGDRQAQSLRRPKIGDQFVRTSSSSTFRERAIDELREFIILTAYLYVCLAAVIYFKAAVLPAQGIAYAPLGVAIIKAAICAKFMLMGRMLHIGERFNPLIVPTLHRVIVFLLLLAVLTLVEEAIVGLIHGRKIWESVSEMGGGTFNQIIATIFIMFLILIPYFAFRSLGDIVGDKILVRLFFERRHSA
jgi:hypothetical protein